MGMLNKLNRLDKENKIMAKAAKKTKSMEEILWDSANKLRGTVESSAIM